MWSSLISFCRSLASRWLLMAAGAFLLSMLVLIGNLYSSQIELRKNADARLASTGEARGAAIGAFLNARRETAIRLAASEDIGDYFSNRDLGMSVQYGLFANLAAIERRFKATMDEEKYQDQHTYLGLIFSTATASRKCKSARPGYRRRATWLSPISGSTKSAA